MNVELRCTRRGCPSAICGDEGREVAAAAWAAGWHHDSWFWWCAEHKLIPDTLPSPAPVPIHDEETVEP